MFTEFNIEFYQRLTFGMDRSSQLLNKRIFSLNLLSCRKLLLERIKIKGDKYDRRYKDKNNKQIN